MSRSRLVLGLLTSGLLSLSLTGCFDAKPYLDKGVVDDSTPPGRPDDNPAGKADNPAQTVAVSLQSPHPYANNLDQTYRLDLSALPRCASQVRVHFKVLQTERYYDFLNLVGPTGVVGESYDGDRSGSWSAWFEVPGDRRWIDVMLSTDDSVVRHGFEIDLVEWQGSAICPLVAWPACAADQIDVLPPPGVCGCPHRPECAALAAIQIDSSLRNGRMIDGKRAVGDVAYDLGSSPSDGIMATEVGTLNHAALGAWLRDAAAAGLFVSDGYARDGALPYRTLTLVAGDRTVTFAAPQGAHDAAVQTLLDRFDALFACDAGAAAASCAGGRSCTEGACTPVDDCSCSKELVPVCGDNGATFDNSCLAACAGASVRHTDACGTAGDACGGFAGFGCQDAFKCRYGAGVFTAPHADAMGACVQQTYCDAAPDCNALPHIAVPGRWACRTNACAWDTTAPAFTPLAGFSFSTAHPYANNTSVWRELYLPAGTTKMRLSATGTFALEQGYDFLEVWTWQNGAWRKTRSFTGRTAPTASDVFAGRYFYLRFASDSSVTADGFSVGVEYSTQP